MVRRDSRAALGTVDVQQPGRGWFFGYSTRVGATTGYGFGLDVAIDRLHISRLEISNVAPLRAPDVPRAFPTMYP
jgi:hypothetical protein